MTNYVRENILILNNILIILHDIQHKKDFNRKLDTWITALEWNYILTQHLVD